MKNMKITTGLAFLLNTFLFATSYAVSKGTLARIDPIIFSFLVMMALVPVALGILAFSWSQLSREVIKSGFVLGSCLCLGLFTIYIALKYNSATSTAFYPSLNGFVAAVAAWFFLRHPIHKSTWLAGIVSVCGAALLIVNSPMGGVRGALIAFIGGLICTFYVFLADHEQRNKTAYWPLFGVELLTMAVWAGLAALLFGDWQMIHPVLPNDLSAILYIAFGTIFLPTLITVLLQNSISPVTVSFIYILEPVLGAIVANIYLREVLPLNGYLGGGLIVVGALIHTWGMAVAPVGESSRRPSQALADQRLRISRLITLGYPLLCFGAGLFLVYRLGGFPPLAWRELYRLGPQLPIGLQQGDRTTWLLLAQATSWLLAWGVLTIMGLLGTYRACERILFTADPAAFPSDPHSGHGNRASSPIWGTVDLTPTDSAALYAAPLSAPIAAHSPALPGGDQARRFADAHPVWPSALEGSSAGSPSIWSPTVGSSPSWSSVGSPPLKGPASRGEEQAPVPILLDPQDLRALRQMGISPSTASLTKNRDAQQVAERRCRGRRTRLARVEFVE